MIKYTSNLSGGELVGTLKPFSQFIEIFLLKISWENIFPNTKVRLGASTLGTHTLMKLLVPRHLHLGETAGAWMLAHG